MHSDNFLIRKSGTPSVVAVLSYAASGKFYILSTVVSAVQVNVRYFSLQDIAPCLGAAGHFGRPPERISAICRRRPPHLCKAKWRDCQLLRRLTTICAGSPEKRHTSLGIGNSPSHAFHQARRQMGRHRDDRTQSQRVEDDENVTG